MKNPQQKKANSSEEKKGDNSERLNAKLDTLDTRSITGVNPKRSHGVGLWGNPRVVMGIRVDSELKKRFILVSKRVFGSICNPIESFMATVVSCSEKGVNFGNTVSIEKIIIERNLRERRSLEFSAEEKVSRSRLCRVCGSKTYALVTRHNGERVCLCQSHFLKEKSRLSSWRVLSVR